MLRLIFLELDDHDLLIVSSVCSHWNRVAWDELLWKKLFNDGFGILPLPDDSDEYTMNLDRFFGDGEKETNGKTKGVFC
jgi:hypothetical protein